MNIKEIKKKIKAKGVKKSHLATLLGVSLATLSMALNGRRKGEKYKSLLNDLVKIL